MAGPLRVGGRAIFPDGTSLLWSMAEGKRGRRWREAVVRGGAVLRSLLLEVDSAGRPTRLEIVSASGLLTLHPEPDESAMHGNVVTPSGVRHLAFAWSAAHELIVEGSIAALAVAAGRSAGREVPVLLVDDTLAPSSSARPVAALELDADGLPVLRDGERWPLELD